MPYRPASVGPLGVNLDVIATSKSLYGPRWRRASTSSYRSVETVIGSSERKQVEQDREILDEVLSEPPRVETDHRCVRLQHAGTDAEHEATAREVVEEHRTIGHPQRVVVRQRDHAGTEADAGGPRRHVAAEDLRRGDRLDASGVVLAEPRLFEAERLEELDRLRVGCWSASVGFWIHAARGTAP